MQMQRSGALHIALKYEFIVTHIDDDGRGRTLNLPTCETASRPEPRVLLTTGTPHLLPPPPPPPPPPPGSSPSLAMGFRSRGPL